MTYTSMLYIEGTISCSILLVTIEGLGFGGSFPDQTRERVPQTASRTRLNGIRTQHPNKKTTMAETPLPHHEIPSLPATPEPKRTKYTEPAANLTVACTFPNPPPVNTTYTYCTTLISYTTKLTPHSLQQSSTPPNQPQPPKQPPSQTQWLPPVPPNRSNNNPQTPQPTTPPNPQPSKSNSSPPPPAPQPAAPPTPPATTCTPRKQPPSPLAAKSS